MESRPQGRLARRFEKIRKDIDTWPEWEKRLIYGDYAGEKEAGPGTKGDQGQEKEPAQNVSSGTRLRQRDWLARRFEKIRKDIDTWPEWEKRLIYGDYAGKKEAGPGTKGDQGQDKTPPKDP